MNLNHILNMLAGQPGLLIVLAVVGLVGVALGVMSLCRTPKNVRIGPVVLVLVGLAAIGVAGLALFRGPALPDDFEDAARLAELQKANLERVDVKAEAAGLDWPQWRGPRRDGVSTETGLHLDWTDRPPAVLWRKKIGKGYSSVAVSGGRAYATDRIDNDERVLCFDAATGKELWSHRYPAVYEGFVSHAHGPRATPTVHDGRVYTVGATGVFLCLEAMPADGKPKVHWQHHLLQEFDATLPEWGVACSPLIEGDLVIVQPGGSGGSVAAFHRLTGELVWKALSERSGYSSSLAVTAAGVRQIVGLTGLGAFGLSPDDGRKLWYFPWQPQFHANIATPVVAGDYVFVSASYSAGCALIRIEPDGGELKAEPVYVKRNRVMRNHISTCVLHDGHLYGFDDSILKCLDMRTCEEKWHSREPGKGCVTLAEGRLIVLTENGLLAVVEAMPGGFQKHGQLQVLQGSEVWAPPALADGRLYVRDHDEVVCLNLKK